MNLCIISILGLITNLQCIHSLEIASNLEAYTMQSSSSTSTSSMSTSSFWGAFVNIPSGITSGTTVDLNPIVQDETLRVSGEAGSTTWYYFDLTKYIGNQIPMVEVTLSCGTGNAEIYVSYDELPTSWNADVANVAACSTDDIDEDNNEICNIFYEPGRFYIMVYGESTYVDAKLTWTLVSVPWNYRRMCANTATPYKVTAPDPNQIYFYYWLDEWKIEHVSGMEIFAWNDGHRLTVFDPELKCLIENFNAHITGEVSICSYNRTHVANGELTEGYYYITVFPAELLSIEREFDVNVLLRLYYALTWRLYLKAYVVGSVTVYYERIVLNKWYLIFHSYTCIGTKCWFFPACVCNDESVPGIPPIRRRRRRRRNRRIRRLRGGGSWSKGGNDGGSNWNKGGSNWGSDGGSNWNKGGSNWGSDGGSNWNKPSDKSCDKSKPTPRPTPRIIPPTPRPTPPFIIRPTPRPLPPPLIRNPTSSPTGLLTPPPLLPSLQPTESPIELPPPLINTPCYVHEWNDVTKEWEIYLQDDCSLAPREQCVTHCTAVRNFYMVYIIGDYGVISKYNTITNEYEVNDLSSVFIQVRTACVVQDDLERIYLIGAKGYVESDGSIDSKTYTQVYNWATGSWQIESPHPVDNLIATTCSYHNGMIYTFGGLRYYGDIISPEPFDGIYAYDVVNEYWITAAISTLPFPNWGMRQMVDVTDGYVYLVGGYAYSEVDIVSATDSGLADGASAGLFSTVFPDTPIDQTQPYNKSLVQVFDFMTNITKFETGFAAQGLQLDFAEDGTQIVGGDVSITWAAYRAVMSRSLTTIITKRKIVWGRNITFIANTTNITDCPTPYPTKSPVVETTTKKPTMSTTKKTTSTTRSTTKTTSGWNNEGKGKSNAMGEQAAFVENIHPAQPMEQPMNGGGNVGVTENVKTWMVYGLIFSVLLFIVLTKLACDNHSYRKQLSAKNYMHGVSKGNEANIDDDNDDDTEEEVDDDEDDNHENNENDQIDVENEQNVYA